MHARQQVFTPHLNIHPAITVGHGTHSAKQQASETSHAYSQNLGGGAATSANGDAGGLRAVGGGSPKSHQSASAASRAGTPDTHGIASDSAAARASAARLEAVKTSATHVRFSSSRTGRLLDWESVEAQVGHTFALLIVFAPIVLAPEPACRRPPHCSSLILVRWPCRG